MVINTATSLGDTGNGRHTGDTAMASVVYFALVLIWYLATATKTDALLYAATFWLLLLMGHLLFTGNNKEVFMKVEIFKDKAGQWRWHIKARNGRITVDSGQGYKTRFAARRAVRRNLGL